MHASTKFKKTYFETSRQVEIGGGHESSSAGHSESSGLGGGGHAPKRFGGGIE
jgi:hypothetical protein